MPKAFFPLFEALGLGLPHRPVLVAVSGGADSLALALAYAAFREASAATAPWQAVTVDHQLRPESTEESAQVAAWLRARSIPHETLTWHHPPLQARIEEQAREARYALLTAHAQAHGFDVILTAHHALDQIETALMRAVRGSGLTGLSGMALLSRRDDVSLARPFLSVFPEALKAFLARQNQPFITDASNLDERFERARWRKRLAEAPKPCLEGVSRSLQNLQRLEVQLQAVATTFLQAEVTRTPSGFLFPLKSFQALLPAVGERALRGLLQTFSPRPCPQRILEGLRNKLAESDGKLFQGATAHGCVLRRIQGGRIMLRKEERRLP